MENVGYSLIKFAEVKDNHGIKIDLETCHAALGPTMKKDESLRCMSLVPLANAILDSTSPNTTQFYGYMQTIVYHFVL